MLSYQYSLAGGGLWGKIKHLLNTHHIQGICRSFVCIVSCDPQKSPMKWVFLSSFIDENAGAQNVYNGNTEHNSPKGDPSTLFHNFPLWLLDERLMLFLEGLLLSTYF